MSVRARKRPVSKLDEWLREGAAGKKPALDIDRELMSTTNRLLKEKLSFKKLEDVHDVAQVYKDSGFFILEREKEQEAIRRIMDLIASNQLPPSAADRVRMQNKKVKKWKKGKKKKSHKTKKSL